MARSMEEIAQLLENTRFRARLIGGVDEDDVWCKIKRLNEEYVALIEALEERHRGALQECRERIASLEGRSTDAPEQPIVSKGMREIPDDAQRQVRSPSVGDE